MFNLKVYKLFLSFLFLLGTFSIYAQGGLMFNANDSIINKRTSYNVFEYKKPVFKNHLYISFDISLWDTLNFGYIFNLVTKNNSYSFNYLYRNGSALLNFNVNSKDNKLNVVLSHSKLDKKNWIRVKFDFDLKNDKAIVNIDGQKYGIDSLGLLNDIKPQLVFGKNQYYTEVPQMAIRNLSVGDNKETYSFPLKEWEGNVVHASSGESIGMVENPIWLINESFFWKQIYNRKFNDVRGLNYDSINHKLLIYGKDSIIFFDNAIDSATTFAYKNQLPIPMILGKNIFNSKENRLYAYEIYNEKKGALSIASLNMKTLEWQALGKAKLKEQRHHHNVFYDANQDSIYIFGGYGGYAYHNIFYSYNKANDKWQKASFTGDTIAPRFFSAAGNSDANDPNEIFIFGGYGNKSGNQVVGGHQYYDLYRVNLSKHTIKKCWEIHPRNDVFVPANNLILSADKKYFYVLCYPHEAPRTALRLYQFSIKDGAYKIVSSPIPTISERIETDINLFLSRKTNKLLCTVQEFIDPKKSNIKIYSLAFPPVSKISLSNIDVAKPTSSLKWIYLLCISIFVLVLTAAMVVYRRKRTQNISFKVDEENREDPLQQEPNVKIEEKYNETVKTNAVYLLGEFKVFDKKGMDISHLLSPKIRQLFILILLNSRDNGGITSRKISSILWSDKDIAKTKNIKGVTLNHLRSILTDIKGIHLVFSGETYSFEITTPFFCDYYAILDRLGKQDNSVDNADVAFFHLISRGALLKDMDDMWLDNYKYDFGKRLITSMIINLDGFFQEKDYAIVLSITKIVTDIDPFNELAFRYALNSYRKTKGIDYCKKIYKKFADDYERSLGEPYASSLEDLLF